jgi:hypothetical protein
VAEAAPNALIVATGYPLLFDDPDLLETQINDATTRLNCAIDKAVADAQTAGINIVYVDVTEAFDGPRYRTAAVRALHQPTWNWNKRLPPDSCRLRCLCRGHFSRTTELLGDKQEQVA